MSLLRKLDESKKSDNDLFGNELPIQARAKMSVIFKIKKKSQDELILS